MKNFYTNTGDHDEWLTPPYIIKALGKFDLDPCAPISRPWPTARKHYTVKDDGLSKPWPKGARIWLNPPYGKETFTWMEKLADHGNGAALIFSRTETKGFHREIFRKADGIFFFEGRLAFYKIDGTKGNTANAPSCLVSYSKADTEAIVDARIHDKIKGIWIRLNS